MNLDPRSPEELIKVLRVAGKKYAEAKAQRVYLEQFRKSQKAILMQKAESAGENITAKQERDAYAHPEYQDLLKGLQIAVEEEERARYGYEAAKLELEVWRTQRADERAAMNLV
jgi:hypothetical protein